MNVINKIHQYLNSGECSLPGFSLGIVHKGVVSYFNYGTFSGEASPMVTQNTPYDLASISKLYTLALLLRLHQNKHINIYAQCSLFFDSFNGSTLRIIDLMTHRANFGIRLQEIRMSHPLNFKDIVFQIPAPKTIAEDVYYENITYIYLGKIIEIITSRSLAENFLDLFKEFDFKETFLGLLNQNDFIAPPTELLEEKTIQNYTHDESARLFGGVAGNAGIFASCSDLLKFGELWINNKIVSEENLSRLIFTNHNSNGKHPQGLGWWNRVQAVSTSDTNIFSHTGFTGGLLALHIESKKLCAFLCNRTVNGRNEKSQIKIWEILTEFLISE